MASSHESHGTELTTYGQDQLRSPWYGGKETHLKLLGLHGKKVSVCLCVF